MVCISEKSVIGRIQHSRMKNIECRWEVWVTSRWACAKFGRQYRRQSVSKVCSSRCAPRSAFIRYLYQAELRSKIQHTIGLHDKRKWTARSSILIQNGRSLFMAANYPVVINLSFYISCDSVAYWSSISLVLGFYGSR